MVSVLALARPLMSPLLMSFIPPPNQYPGPMLRVPPQLAAWVMLPVAPIRFSHRLLTLVSFNRVDKRNSSSISFKTSCKVCSFFCLNCFERFC